MGKLITNELKTLLKCIKKDQRIIIPPSIGYDSGIHKINTKHIAVATDPCTGVPKKWFGWLLINYAASDLALSGAQPEFCTINLLGPTSTKPATFQKIMKQICKAAKELNIAIIRGHTGTYDSLSDMIGVTTVYGPIKLKNLITPANAKPGNLILCTKPLGLETITNFATSNKPLAQKLFGPEQQKNLSKEIRMQTCVPEALQLAKSHVVQAMHDATEGGFASALKEMAEASKVGFRINWEKLPITKEALALQTHFKLTDQQLLSMSSTGTILAAIEPKDKQKVEKALRKNNLKPSFIGEFTREKTQILTKHKKETSFPQNADDPYSQILSSKPKKKLLL
jgi:hydrogenase maturation factor